MSIFYFRKITSTIKEIQHFSHVIESKFKSKLTCKQMISSETLNSLDRPSSSNIICKKNRNTFAL